MNTRAIFLMVFFWVGGRSMLDAQTGFEKEYGMPGCYDEAFSVVSQPPYIHINGITNCPGRQGHPTGFLLTLNGAGDSLWMQESPYYNGYSLLTDEGDLVIAGSTNGRLFSDSLYIASYDLQGQMRFLTRFSFGNCNNSVSGIVEIPDSGFAVCGYFSTSSCSNPQYDAFLIRFDRWGNPLWQRTYGGGGNDELFGIAPMAGHRGYYLAGWTDGQGAGGADIWLIQTDKSGFIQREKTIGDSRDNFGYGIISTASGDIYISGYSDSLECIRLDSHLTIQWHKRYALACGGRDFKVFNDDDGTVLLLGQENKNASCSSVLLKLNAQGGIHWRKRFNGTLRDLVITGPGKYILAGYRGLPPQIYTLTFDSTTVVSYFPEKAEENRVHIFSTGDRLYLQGIRISPAEKMHAEIFDVSGKLVYQEAVDRNSIHLKSPVAGGMYFVRLTGNGRLITGRFIR